MVKQSERKREKEKKALVKGAALLAAGVAMALAWPWLQSHFPRGAESVSVLDVFVKWVKLSDAQWARYAAWLVKWNYPWLLTLWVLPGVVFYGLVLSIGGQGAWAWVCAPAGWVVGLTVGFTLKWLVSFSPGWEVHVAPLLALFFGLWVPVLFKEVPEYFSPPWTNVERGAFVTEGYAADSAKALREAASKGGTALVGVVLSPEEETRHFAVVGITGSGKTTALRGLMQYALARGDRHIVADPDGGYLSVFLREGDVILNPFDARGAKWDLLSEVESESDYRFLAESVLPYTGAREADAWTGYAQQIFAACLRAWRENSLGTSDDFIRALATASTEKLAALCEGSAAHRYFEKGNERMLAGVMGTLAPALEGLQQLARVEGEPFSVRRWVREGNRGNLWMPYRANQVAALRGLVSCWMRLAIFEGLSLAPSQTRRLWYHVDELDAIGRIEGLKDAQSRLRKFGGCVVLGFQSIAQVRAVYGDADARTIVENCGNKLILRCEESEGGGTARFASEIIGEREMVREEKSHSKSGGGFWGGRPLNVTESTHFRRYTEKAVLPSEVMQLPDRTGFLKLSGRAGWMRVRFDFVGLEPKAETYVPLKMLAQVG